jgi:hypothetical protein
MYVILLLFKILRFSSDFDFFFQMAVSALIVDVRLFAAFM